MKKLIAALALSLAIPFAAFADDKAPAAPDAKPAEAPKAEKAPEPKKEEKAPAAAKKGHKKPAPAPAPAPAPEAKKDEGKK